MRVNLFLYLCVCVCTWIKVCTSVREYMHVFLNWLGRLACLCVCEILEETVVLDKTTWLHLCLICLEHLSKVSLVWGTFPKKWTCMMFQDRMNQIVTNYLFIYFKIIFSGVAWLPLFCSSFLNMCEGQISLWTHTHEISSFCILFFHFVTVRVLVE